MMLVACGDEDGGGGRGGGGDGDGAGGGTTLRQPGPSLAERGMVLLWDMDEPDLGYSRCTDNADLRAQLETELEAAQRDLLAYRVAQDGSTARMMECTQASMANCQDDPMGIELGISGNTMTYRPTPDVIDLQGTCDARLTSALDLVDRGDTLDLDLTISVDLVGDQLACAAVEAGVQAGSSNGEGLDGCVVSVTSRGDFAGAL